jgi:hypothetical protein
MGIKLTPKMYPASPDPVLKKSSQAEAAVARFAHVNALTYELNDIAFYELDIASSLIVNVTTSKGIIEILNMDTYLPDPAPAFGSYVNIVIGNPEIVIAGRDKTYVQLTPYYSQIINDNAIPYVMPVGALPAGLDVRIYNASPDTADPGQWGGAFYLYYEIKVLV